MNSNFGKIAPTGVVVRSGQRGGGSASRQASNIAVGYSPRYRSAAISIPSNRKIRLQNSFTGYGLASVKQATMLDPFFLTAITLLTSAVVMLTSIIISSGTLPQISSSFVPTLNIALNNNGGARHEYMAKLSAKQLEQMEQQVSYVSDLIHNRNVSSREADKLAAAIVTESLRANYDPLFVAAVIKSESTFRSGARSPVGALGLMQIMPETAKFVSNMRNMKWLGTGSLRNVEYNIQLGIAYLKHLEDVFGGNRERALIAYNWGPANLQDALNYGHHIPLSTIAYARTIIGTHGRWQRKFSEIKEQYALKNPETLDS